MKFILLLMFSLISLGIEAKDGLVTQFTITKTNKISEETETRQSYNRAVLVEFNETNSFDFKDLYTFKITTRTDNFKDVNLLITLKDLSSGKPYFIGVQSTDLTVGDAESFKFERSGVIYNVDIDTSYGKLP